MKHQELSELIRELELLKKLNIQEFYKFKQIMHHMAKTRCEHHMKIKSKDVEIALEK